MILLNEITIPELSKEEGTFFILAGAPASGKSTLVNYIQSINPQVRIFNSDDYRKLILQKAGREDLINKPSMGETAHKTAASLTRKMLQNYFASRKPDYHKTNIIYDTTAKNIYSVLNIAKLAHDQDYRVVMLHCIVPLQTSLERNRKRDRIVDEDVLRRYYENQQEAMEEIYASNLIDKYYIIYSDNLTTLSYEYTADGIKRLGKFSAPH